MERREVPARVGLTYSDYAALLDELDRGELSVTPQPGTRHQSAVVRLIVRIDEHVRSRGLGKVFGAPTDCILSNTTVSLLGLAATMVLTTPDCPFAASAEET